MPAPFLKVVPPSYTQEADGLVYAYILIWVAKNCGRSATGFEGVFVGFYMSRFTFYRPIRCRDRLFVSVSLVFISGRLPFCSLYS